MSGSGYTAIAKTALFVWVGVLATALTSCVSTDVEPDNSRGFKNLDGIDSERAQMPLFHGALERLPRPEPRFYDPVHNPRRLFDHGLDCLGGPCQCDQADK